MDIAIQDSNAAIYRYAPPTVNRDQCEVLSQEIATLAGQLNAANHRFLILIAEFDERGGWAVEGAQSCAHWLNFKCGIDLGAAREKLRVAHALSALPKIGEIPWCRVCKMGTCFGKTKIATVACRRLVGWMFFLTVAVPFGVVFPATSP